MTPINQPQLGSLRWFTGLIALGLIVFIHLQPAFLAAAIWLATHHGHEHQIAVRSDGNHFDVRLSHDYDHGQPAADHQLDSSSGLLAALFSTHDHDGTDHVLHFMLGEAPDQIRLRNSITAAQTSAPSVAIVATSSPFPLSTPTKLAAAILPASSPPLSAGLLGLRTTVLLV